MVYGRPAAERRSVRRLEVVRSGGIHLTRSIESGHARMPRPPLAGTSLGFRDVRLERVTEENSGDLRAYAAEREALKEGGPLLVEAVTNPAAYLEHVRCFAEATNLPPNRVQGFE